MITYQVKRYNPYREDPRSMGQPEGTHTCLVDRHDGKDLREEYVDLMVNGDFPKDTDPESLVGRTFEAEYDYPYVSIAMGVREVVTPAQGCTGPGGSGEGGDMSTKRIKAAYMADLTLSPVEKGTP